MYLVALHHEVLPRLLCLLGMRRDRTQPSAEDAPGRAMEAMSQNPEPPKPRKWSMKQFRKMWQVGWLDGYHGRSPDPSAKTGSTQEQAYYEGHAAGVQVRKGGP